MIKIDFDEFEYLAENSSGNQEFCDLLIKQLVLATGAHGGIFWDCASTPIRATSRFSLEETVPIQISERDHVGLLSRAAVATSTVVIRPKSEKASDDDEHPLIFLAPVVCDQMALIELIVPLMESDQEADFVRMLNRVCQIAATRDDDRTNIEGVKTEAAFEPVDVKRFEFDELNNYIGALHGSIDRSLTCANVANENRKLLECDRVSVVLRYRGGFRIFAVSGQISVNRRSGTLLALEKLAKTILKTGQTFWYPDDTEIPTQLSSILDEYLQTSATRSLIIEPVFEKTSQLNSDPDSTEKKSNPVVGGIVYEHCNEQWSRESYASAISVTTRHSSNAIRNTQKHHGLFLYPLWNLLGKSRILAAPRVLPKTLMVVFAIVIVSLVLAFWPTDFYVVGNGVLVPCVIRPIYATQDSVVDSEDDIMVEHGQFVDKGDLLVRLTSEELELQLGRVVGSIQQLEKRKSSQHARRARRVDGAQSRGSEDSLKSLEEEIASLRNQEVRLNRMVNKLEIVSPIAGQVISWDVKQQLRDHPVNRGQILLEVAHTQGEWELLLDLEDRRIGHLTKALRESKSGRLRASFVLAADPSNRLRGEIVEIGKATELTAEKKQTIRVRIEIAKDDAKRMNIKQARTGVTVRLICGRSSLGYLWMHDVGEFFQKNVFFYFSS